MKPMISYYGGKQRMLKNLIPLVTPHKIYVEPFCGGASLFFALDIPDIKNDHHYKCILNDKNEELINMYKVAVTKKQEFLDMLESIPYSESIFQKFKKNQCEQDDITLAVGFYVRNMMSFSYILDSGFSFGKIGRNFAKTFFNHRERLPQILKKLSYTIIFNRDALDIIKRFDSEETFIYCDPPYPNANQGAYSGYTQKDFEKLIDIIKDCKSTVMLSCYENDYVPKNWEKHEFKTRNTSSKINKGGHRESRTECVWIKRLL